METTTGAVICDCPEPDAKETGMWCERHQCAKSHVMVVKCHTDEAWWQAWEEGRGPRQANRALPRPHPPAVASRAWRLGDHVEKALSTVGITSERVEAWVGRPCGCGGRKDKLNRLGAWAERVLIGETGDAEERLKEILE